MGEGDERGGGGEGRGRVKERVGGGWRGGERVEERGGGWVEERGGWREMVKEREGERVEEGVLAYTTRITLLPSRP